MLADDTPKISSGALHPDLHREGEWLDALVDFILDQMPEWRDWPDRPHITSETKLTFQLCMHLNSAAAQREGLDSLCFVTEVPDPVTGGRTLDLVPLPRGRHIWIANRRHTHFDPLLPIECKRLPTPPRRDKREYLRTAKGSKGGVQRFKNGHHGSSYNLGVLIAYVQTKDVTFWRRSIDRWIRAFARVKLPGWTNADRLQLDVQDLEKRVVALTSINSRIGTLTPVRIRHLWIEIS